MHFKINIEQENTHKNKYGQGVVLWMLNIVYSLLPLYSNLSTVSAKDKAKVSTLVKPNFSHSKRLPVSS